MKRVMVKHHKRQGFTLVETMVTTGVSTILALSVGGVMVQTWKVHQTEQARAAITSTAKDIRNTLNSKIMRQADCANRINFVNGFNDQAAQSTDGVRVQVTNPANGKVYRSGLEINSNGKAIIIDDVVFANAVLAEEMPTGENTYSGDVYLVAQPKGLLFGGTGSRRFVTRMNVTVNSQQGNALIACNGVKPVSGVQTMCERLGLDYEPNCPHDPDGCCHWRFGPRGGAPATVRFCPIGQAGQTDGRVDANCVPQRNRCGAGLARGFVDQMPECESIPQIVENPTPPTTPPVAACDAGFYSGCSVGTASSGGTSGSCAAGYNGSCSYRCDNAAWVLISNTCTVDQNNPPAPTPPGTVTPPPSSVDPECLARYQAYMSVCANPYARGLNASSCSGGPPPIYNCVQSTVTPPVLSSAPPPPPPVSTCSCGTYTINSGQYCGYCTVDSSYGYGITYDTYEVRQCQNGNLVTVPISYAEVSGNLTMSCRGQRRPVNPIGPGRYRYQVP